MNDDTQSFSISLRILGNEIIGFSMQVDDFKTKWAVIGVFVTISILAAAATFGPEIQSMLS